MALANPASLKFVYEPGKASGRRCSSRQSGAERTKCVDFIRPWCVVCIRLGIRAALHWLVCSDLTPPAWLGGTVRIYEIMAGRLILMLWYNHVDNFVVIVLAR